MSKEILLTSNYTLNFTHHNVNHYVNACKERGFTARIVNSFDMHKEKNIPFGIINLAGYPNETHLRFLRKNEIDGAISPNSVYASLIAEDKALSNMEISRIGLPVPKTVDLHVSSFDRLMPEYIGNEIGFPCVIKYPRLGYGMGIHLVNNQDEFSSIFDLLSLCSSKSANYMSNTNLIAQEYISTTKSRQLKVFILNKELIGSYYYENTENWKISRKGSVDVPRTDNAPGGKIIYDKIEIDSTLKEQCIKICNSMNINFACIDVFFGKDGYIFNELNTAPGFHRCYPDVPVAHLVLEYMINSKITS